MAKKDKAKEKEAEGKDADAAPPAEGAAAEATEGTEGAEGAPAKKSKKKLIIIGAAALVVLLAGGAGAFFMLSGGEKKEEVAAEGELGPDGKPVLTVVYYTLPEFLVNLNTGGKQTSFLKAVVVLEVEKQNDIAAIEANLPRLMDGYNTYLRELRASDLSGSAGVQRLREELLLRANKALAPVKINDVLFKNIVVQ